MTLSLVILWLNRYFSYKWILTERFITALYFFICLRHLIVTTPRFVLQFYFDVNCQFFKLLVLCTFLFCHISWQCDSAMCMLSLYTLKFVTHLHTQYNPLDLLPYSHDHMISSKLASNLEFPFKIDIKSCNSRLKQLSLVAWRVLNSLVIQVSDRGNRRLSLSGCLYPTQPIAIACSLYHSSSSS